MEKLKIKGCLVFLVVSALVFLSIPVLGSCVPVTGFGDLTVARDIDPQTSAPVNPDNVFDFGIQKIYIVIEASNVDADDIKRFTLKNKQTGEIVLDESDKYMSGKDGLVEGYFYMELSVAEGMKYMLYPGEYTAEFYHKGELKDTQDFTITEPEVEILEVVLADQIDENTSQPLNITNEFLDTDDFYAVIKVSLNLEGDYFEAEWYYEEEGLINTTRVDIEEDYYDENYVSFKLFSEAIWPEGNYSVDLYQNGSLIGQYNFSVIPTQVEEGAEDPFSQDNVYINEDYGFGFAVPDNWSVYDSEQEGELTVEVVYEQDPEVYLYFTFAVMPALDKEDYESASNEFAETILGTEGMTLVDEASGEYVNANDIGYYEYNYLYNDEDGKEWNIILNYFENDERTYMMISLAMQDFYENGSIIYQGILNSFTLLE